MKFPTIVDPFDDEDRDRPISKFHTQDVRARVEPSVDSEPLAVVAQTYPRIHARIKELWGTYALQLQFTRWLLVDQEGRKGWPESVRDALFDLSNHHADIFGFEVTPIWDGRKDTW